MYSIILIIHVIIAIAMIGMILIQKTDGDGMGGLAGGNSNVGSIFGGRAKASFMTRTTAILAASFFVTSLSLAYLASARNGKSILDSAPAAANPAVPAPTSAPVVPKAK